MLQLKFIILMTSLYSYIIFMKVASFTMSSCSNSFKNKWNTTECLNHGECLIDKLLDLEVVSVFLCHIHTISISIPITY